MNQIEVAGVRVAYERAGAGPELVLLHGGFGFDGRSWLRQLDALSDTFTVVAWDMPGCGRSADPPETFRASDFADCLAAFIGALALELYRRQPTIPQSLILASAYAGWAGSLPPEAVEQRKSQALRALALSPEQWARRWSPSMLSASAPAELTEEVEASLSTSHPDGQRVIVSAFGDQDVRSPVSVGEDLHARIPGSQFVVMPRVGHVSNIEAPERFNAAVRAFLQSLDA